MIAVEHLTKDFGRIAGGARRVVPRRRAARRSACSGPTARARRRSCAPWPASFRRPAAASRWPASTSSAEPLRARGQVGYLPESATWYPDMRVGEFLDFCADVRRLRGAARGGRGSPRCSSGCGLADVRARVSSAQLSKGYRQRVGLAQALLHEPAVLILDEPTVGLDPRQVVEIRALVRALRGRTTVLLSTHILSEVATVCDRVVIIDRGRVVAEDTRRRRWRAPAARPSALSRARRGAGRAPCAAALRGRAPSVTRGRAAAERRRYRARLLVTACARCRAGAGAGRRGGGARLGSGEMRALTLSLEDLFVRLTGRRGRADELPRAAAQGAARLLRLAAVLRRRRRCSTPSPASSSTRSSSTSCSTASA